MPINLNKEISIRIADPRIILNEFFGYLSFTMGLVTALFVILGLEDIYNVSNQILLFSCGAQNIPLLMVYIPQYRLFLTTGILGIIITNYFATNPIGNSFREGLFVGMIKVDYSYEALVKYHPETYKSERALLRGRRFLINLGKYISTVAQEMVIRSGEMLEKLRLGEWNRFIDDAIRSQYFSSLLRIISATPLFIIAGFGLAAINGFYEKTEFYIATAALWTTISVRTLAFSSFIGCIQHTLYTNFNFVLVFYLILLCKCKRS